MPRWPEAAGQEVRRLEGWTADEPGPPSDEHDRTFRLRFDAAPAAAGEEVLLAFDGIATVFTVELNGEAILEGSSQFLAHVVDVGDRLREGANELVIRCRALAPLLAEAPRRPRQRWRTKVVPDGSLRWLRTQVLGRAPGFAPGPPVVGPWRPVWLVRRSGAVVEELALRPRVEGEDGVLAVRARVRGAEQLTVHVGGASAVAPVGPDGAVALEVRVPVAERWWPHTHGTPALHDVRLELGDGGVTVDGGRVGFRALSPGADHDVDAESLALAIGGVPVFCRGALWTPVAEDEMRPTLERLREAGMNMVRLPGTGAYETPAFFDACDELGILVWQDFMFANLDYPIADEGFRAQVEAEARQALAQVAGRPSLAVLCGNSEVEQQAAMFGADPAIGRGALFGELLPALAREAGADVPYVPSAPCGGALPFHPSAGVANYFGVGGYRRPLGDARAAGVRFASECLAFSHVPDGGGDDRAGVPGDVGADWDFADVRDHYLALLYDVDPAALRAEDPARYAALARQATGDASAAVFGEWRRGASPCAGGLILWLRDVMPGAGWGLLDHTGAPKAALGPLRRVLAPLAAWIVDEGLGGLDVHVANDGPEPVEAELHVALLAGGERAIEDARAPVVLAAHETTAVNVEGVLGRFADAAYAYRFGPPAHDAVVATLARGGEVLAQAFHFPLGPPLERRDDLGLQASARRLGDGAIAVELRSARLAWGVRVAAPGCVASDDAFSLAPGSPRTIVLTRTRGQTRCVAQHEGSDPMVVVSALNMTGEQSVAVADG